VNAFLTFVAIDEGRPVPIPPLVPETDDEWVRWRAADERRAVRLAARSEGRQVGRAPASS
jgi:acyl-CoA hydrolase